MVSDFLKIGGKNPQGQATGLRTDVSGNLQGNSLPVLYDEPVNITLAQNEETRFSFDVIAPSFRVVFRMSDSSSVEKLDIRVLHESDSGQVVFQDANVKKVFSEFTPRNYFYVDVESKAGRATVIINNGSEQIKIERIYVVGKENTHANLPKSVSFEKSTQANSADYIFRYYGKEQRAANSSSDLFLPFDTSTFPKKMVYLENNTIGTIDFFVAFYHETGRVRAGDYLVKSETISLAQGEKILLTSDGEPLLKEPFPAISVAVASRLNNNAGDYDVRIFGGG